MNKGVELMISHMKTNPDAFRKGRWRNLIARVIRDDGEIFVEGEAEAVKDAVVELEQTLFNGDVMEALAAKPETEQSYRITGSLPVQEDYDSGRSLIEVINHIEGQKREREREKRAVDAMRKKVSTELGDEACKTE